MWEIVVFANLRSKLVPDRVLSGRYRTFAKAAHTRNQMIVNNAASVVAFWDGQSKGTKSTIDKAKAAGILFAVYGPDGQDVLESTDKSERGK